MSLWRPYSCSRSHYWSAQWNTKDCETTSNPNRPWPSHAQGHRGPRATAPVRNANPALIHKYVLILQMRSLARFNEKYLNPPETRFMENNFWRHEREKERDYSLFWHGFSFFFTIPPSDTPTHTDAHRKNRGGARVSGLFLCYKTLYRSGAQLPW